MSQDLPAQAPDPAQLLAAAVEHHQNGRMAEAQALYSKVLDWSPRNAAALNMLGVIAAQDGRYGQARQLVEEALAEQPMNPEFRFNRAHILHLDDHEDTAEAYRHTLAAQPDHVPALVNLGGLVLEMGLLEEAKDCFLRALRVDASLIEAHEGLGFALLRQHRKEEALAAFELALALDSNNPTSLANLGSLLVELRRVEEAIPRIRRAIALAPRDAEHHAVLGVAHHISGDPGAAVAAFATALDLDPYNSRAISGKGIALIELDQPAEAAKIFDYARLLVSRQVTAVPGYPDTDAFNADLLRHLRTDPTLEDQAPSNFTHEGRQSGDLLLHAEGPFRVLADTIRTQVEHYFSALEDHGGHRYLAPLPERWRPCGWATLLGPGGYQDPHNHPGAALSGVYHVQVPKSGAGSIEFGRPPADYAATAAHPVQVIDPKPGLLLLFPGFFWHRILPVRGDEERISIAFNIISRQ